MDTPIAAAVSMPIANGIDTQIAATNTEISAACINPKRAPVTRLTTGSQRNYRDDNIGDLRAQGRRSWMCRIGDCTYSFLNLAELRTPASSKEKDQSYRRGCPYRQMIPYFCETKSPEMFNGRFFRDAKRVSWRYITYLRNLQGKLPARHSMYYLHRFQAPPACKSLARRVPYPSAWRIAL